MIDKAKWVSGGKTLSHWSDRYAGSPESRDQFGGLYVREHSPLSEHSVIGGTCQTRPAFVVSPTRNSDKCPLLTVGLCLLP